MKERELLHQKAGTEETAAAVLRSVLTDRQQGDLVPAAEMRARVAAMMKNKRPNAVDRYIIGQVDAWLAYIANEKIEDMVTRDATQLRPSPVYG